jgi:hypothetical protein
MGSGEVAAADALAIDGRQRCDIKKEGERGNGKVLEGKQAQGLRLLIEAHGWKGEAMEARGKACPDRCRLEQRKGGGRDDRF